MNENASSQFLLISDSSETFNTTIFYNSSHHHPANSFELQNTDQNTSIK